MDQVNHISLSLMGYNRRQVTEILDSQAKKVKELEAQVDQLTQSVEEKEQQLEHFQALEQALTDGIVDARLRGNEIIEASSAEADQIIEQTNEQVIQYKEEFSHHSRELVESGTLLRDNLNNMKNKMQIIIEQYQALIDETDFDSLFPKKQVERLVEQVDAYDNDGLYERINHNKTKQDANLSEEEKMELERLINDVISNEEREDEEDQDDKDDPNNKLVDFAAAKR